MLIPDFYIIKNYQHNENSIHAQIVLNTDHEVFLGHFPDQAVVPGVIQLQIFKELLEKETDQKLLLDQMEFVKFLNAILPSESLLLNFIIDYKETDQMIKLSGTIKDEKMVYTKVRGMFSHQQKGLS